MRIALLGLLMAVASCSDRWDDRDSAFDVSPQRGPASCFENVEDIAAFAETEKGRSRRERGVSEFRVTQREEGIVVVDTQGWDSGDDGRGRVRRRQIFERQADSTQWCQTRDLYK